MSSTQLGSNAATEASAATAVPMRLEVVILRGASSRTAVEMSEVFHDAGNGWMLREITERLPGRV